MKLALSGNSTHYECEFRLRHKDGTYRWILSRSLISRDINGRAVRLVGAHIDITEKKQIEKSLSDSLLLIDTLLEAAPAGIAFFDCSFRYVCLNRALAEEINGVPQAEHLGKTVFEVVPNLAPSVQAAFEKIVATGKPIINQEFNGSTPKCPNESKAWIASFYPLFDKDRVLLGIGTVVLDITDRKRSQQELSTLAEGLKQSNRELEQFASVASHDLKEPLRAVESYLGLLNKRYAGQLDAQADKYIHYAREGARRMYRLVEALRTYAKVGMTPLSRQNIDMQQIVQAALANLDAAIHEARAQITTDPLPKLYADPVQMEQVFQNLISNAIKFSKPEQPPRIHIGAKRLAHEWQFLIEDFGIGISPPDTQRIFEIFRRLHGSDRYPGDGIGLAVSKKIVERHSGKIWVESAVDQGCQFFFTVPDPL